MSIKPGKVEKYINEKLEDKGALLFMVIDPLDYKNKDDAVKAGIGCASGGADVILVGGSVGVQGELLDYVAKEIKSGISDIPLVLFPGNIATISSHADAIYFMSMLNARNPYWIVQAQMLSAPTIRQLGVEPLPVGYIVVKPGGTVGWVGDANLVPREKPRIAAGLALAGEYLGNRLIVTDVGSNPKLQGFGPVPTEMVREVKKAISVPYIVAGGISATKDVHEILGSGADIVQIGTAIENKDNVKNIVSSLSEAVKEEGAKKLRK